MTAYKKNLIQVVLSLLVAALANGCATFATVPPTIPVSRANYTFSYSTPTEKAAASVPATIVVVNPSYKEDESALMAAGYSKVGKGFSASMGEDMDKILIAKGMTAKGPFASRDEIVYSDKRDSTLTLAPKVFITAQIKSAPIPLANTQAGAADSSFLSGPNGPATNEVPFEMRVGGWISFVMQEPLSDEKMWIKKLDIDEVVINGKNVYQGTQVAYNGEADAMADALTQIYPVIMGKFWKFIDPNEILDLKKKTAEIRKMKRY